MNKKILLALLAGVVAIGGCVLWYMANAGLIGKNVEVVIKKDLVATTTVKEVMVNTPLNGLFVIEGNKFQLENGKAVLEIPIQAGEKGSGVKYEVSLFGSPLMTDLDNDGKKEAVAMLQEYSGGTGMFYYIAIAKVDEEGNYKSDGAELLGDRISLQNVEYRDGQVIANYADRKLSESFAVQPSIGVSRYYKYENGILVEDKAKYTSFACIINNGKWLPNNNECEFGFNKVKCEQLAGQFNECASACRNTATSTKPTACTMQCVQVCKFK